MTRLQAILGAGGTGKQMPLNTLILCPDGYKKLECLKIGDYIIGDDGLPTVITYITPTQKLKSWKFIFNDGTSAISCEDHNWRVQTKKLKSLGKWRVMQTKDMIDNINNYRQYKSRRGHYYEIPIIKPVQFSKKDLLLDPYLLGCFLGDGHFTKYGTVKFAVGFNEHKQWENLLTNYSLVKRSPNSTCDYYIFSQFKEKIKQLNLNGKSRDDKFIPREYLYSSIEDRLALLQGLMDTDGSVSVKQSNSIRVSFSNCNKNIVEGVVWLVRSLGGLCTVTLDSRTKYKSTACFNVNIQLNNFNPFRLPRKKELWSNYTIKFPSKKIVSAEYVGEVEGRCLTVNNENKCYVIEDFIVTHNSYNINQQIKADPKYAMRTATTGIAAVNMGSIPGADDPTTINSALQYFNTENLLRKFHEGKTILPLKIIAKKYKNIVIDECFTYDQKVLTEKGWVKIGLLYSQFKKGKVIKVWSKNQQGKLELQPVINAQKNKLNNKKLVEVNVSSSNSKRGARLIKATLNHEIYTPKGKIKIKDLREGDEVIVNSLEFNEDQKSIIIGSLLGDGCMNYSLKRNTPTIKLTQGYKQKEYLEWKHNLLGNLTSSITESKSGYCNNKVFNFILKTTPYLHKIKQTYNNKDLTDEFINSIDLLAIAIWYLDNGSLSKTQDCITLHTERFSKEVNERLANYLNNHFGFNFIVSKFREYYYLRLRKEDALFFLSKISKYIPTCMSYKTTVSCDSYIYNINNLDFAIETIKSITPYSIPKSKKVNKNKTDYVYDLTVDTNHNYIAGNVLVSNCSMMDAGTLDLIVMAVEQYNNRFNADLGIIVSGDPGQLPPVNTCGFV